MKKLEFGVFTGLYPFQEKSRRVRGSASRGVSQQGSFSDEKLIEAKIFTISVQKHLSKPRTTTYRHTYTTRVSALHENIIKTWNDDALSACTRGWGCIFKRLLLSLFSYLFATETSPSLLHFLLSHSLVSCRVLFQLDSFTTYGQLHCSQSAHSVNTPLPNPISVRTLALMKSGNK